MVSIRYTDDIKEWLDKNVDRANLIYEKFECIVTFKDEVDATFFKLQYETPILKDLGVGIFYAPYIPLMEISPK